VAWCPAAPAELVGLLNRDLFLLGVDHEQGARQAAHQLEALEVPRQLLPLPLEQQPFLLGVVAELAVGPALLEVPQPPDLLLDAKLVSMPPSQRSVT
jgi:hypothetical protein